MLSDFAFFIKDVFASLRVVLPGLHLFRMQAFVLGCRIEVSGTGGGVKSDFFAHQIILPVLDSLALRTQVGEHLVDAVLVDDA